MAAENPILSDDPRIIHLNDEPFIVNLHWHPYYYSLNNTQKLISKKSPSDFGVFYSTDLLTQVSFVPNNLERSISPTRPIIEHILENNSLSSLWIFYTTADLDDDTAFVLICDQDGVILDGNELFLSEHEFHELIDEHILVSEGKLNIFTDDFRFMNDYMGQENISLSKIDFSSEGFFDSGEIIKLSSRKILGLAPILFYLSFGLIFSTAVIQGSGLFIEAPEFEITNEPRSIPTSIDESPEWLKLESIFYNSMPSNLFLMNYFESKYPVLSILPSNIAGWDLSSILMKNNDIKFDLSLSSKFTSIMDLQEEIIKNSTIFELTKNNNPTIIVNPDRKSMHYVFSPFNKEMVFNNKTLEGYKLSLKRNDIDSKIIEANQLISSIKEINTEGEFIHEKYLDAGNIELLLGFLTGSLLNDKNIMEELQNSALEHLNNHNKLKKYIYDVPVPDSRIMESILYTDDSPFSKILKKNSSLYSISQKTSLYSITAGEDFNGYAKFVIDIGAKNSNELKYKLNQITDIHNLPIRLINVLYNWKTSKWTLKGEIYASK